ncbi:MAG: hypothetical protein KGL64_09705 [Acidobacteriota bacterium]|nr:hypothetical protein [Acidobacteriota bacterium]
MTLTPIEGCCPAHCRIPARAIGIASWHRAHAASGSAGAALAAAAAREAEPGHPAATRHSPANRSPWRRRDRSSTPPAITVVLLAHVPQG